jgi:hypothetical protein
MFYPLPTKIEHYIGEFAGRAWLLPQILDWYENSSERFLLLTGDPGAGKSMVAAWLAGSGPLPEDPPPGSALPGSLLFDGLLPRQQLERLRSTARVNAMIRRWWPMAEEPDLEDVVREFSRQPDAPGFTALHIVGEDFSLREQSPDKLDLQWVLLNANTLRDLSAAFRLPLADFVVANAGRGWDVDTPLPPGTEVNVPDPEFIPLVAARLAAQVAVADWLFPDEKRALIQSLVPPAVHDRTALDAILARLPLAALPGDPALLDRLLPRQDIGKEG